MSDIESARSKINAPSKTKLCHICGEEAYRVCDECDRPTCAEHLLLDRNWDIFYGMCERCFEALKHRLDQRLQDE